MAYLGTPIDTRNTFQSLQGKRFNGDGSTTAFTLDVAPSSTLDIEVFVGNVRQDPNSAYTLSGTTLTFTGAPPSGTNNIYVVHQAKSVGTITPGANTVGVTELNLSDGSNGQFIKTDGSGTLSFDSAATALDDIATGDAASTLATSAGNITVDAQGNDTDIIFKGTDGGADTTFLTIDGSEGGDLLVGTAPKISSNGAIANFTNHNGSATETALASSDGNEKARCFNDGKVTIEANGSERVRFDSGGNLLHAKTSNNANVVGIELRPSGELTITRTNNQLLDINRTDNDGTLVVFRQANATEGTISVSGTTVSYNSFAGSHWSRLADNSKPTILRGTVMESIGTMINWYQAVADVAESTDSEDNVTPAHQIVEGIALPDGKSAGDAVTFTSNGKEYTGVYVKEDNEQLPMCKISDTEDSKAVYGVFMDWDNDDDNVNDMYITSLGAFVVRIHKDETVAIGDYLQSKGDGTAKKQADDILRASTIAKVTSTEKTHEYADGSYCVPCTLHCG